jgi:hypothetical protein
MDPAAVLGPPHHRRGTLDSGARPARGHSRDIWGRWRSTAQERGWRVLFAPPTTTERNPALPLRGRDDDSVDGQTQGRASIGGPGTAARRRGSKGPTVCARRVLYRADQLEGALLARYQEATTAPMVEALAKLLTLRLSASVRGRDSRVEQVTAEIAKLESAAGRFVRFLAEGDSFTVRGELVATEAALVGLRAELARVEQVAHVQPPRVHPSWIRAKLAELGKVLRGDPVRAQAEITKHLDGPLAITLLPSLAGGEKRAEIRGPGAVSAGSSVRRRSWFACQWSRGRDLNPRPADYEEEGMGYAGPRRSAQHHVSTRELECATLRLAP